MNPLFDCLQSLVKFGTKIETCFFLYNFNEFVPGLLEGTRLVCM